MNSSRSAGPMIITARTVVVGCVLVGSTPACSGTIGDGDYDTATPFGDAANPGAITTDPDDADNTGDSNTGDSNTGDSNAAPPAGSASDEQPTEQSGVQLYTAYCGACHGEAGAGTELAPEVQHPKLDFATWVVRNGFSGAYDPPMAPYDERALTDAQLASILTYLSELPQASSDQGLYLDYCGNCHGADGLGGPADKEVAGEDEVSEIVREGHGGSDYGARQEYMPRWSSDELTPELVTRLEAFVRALPD